MQRRKLLWFAGVGVVVVLVQMWAAASPVPQGATQIVLSRTDGPFSLESGPVHVPLRAMQTRTGAKGRSLAALLERVTADEHVLLVLWRDPRSLVGHLKHYHPFVLCEPDADDRRPRVSHRVADRFLRDAVEV